MPGYIRDCYLIHTAIPILKEYVWDIRMGREDKIKNKIESRVEQLLIELIFFVTETEDNDPFLCEGIPYKGRQKLMRELNLVEVLADALYYPFAEGMFSLERLAEVPPLSRVCGLIYRLLKHIVQDYRLNEEYVAQWIELFFDHAMNTGDDADSYSEATITAILTNNKKLLDKQISRQNIAHIIDLCKNQRKNERFLNLLGCLCICQNQAVVGNQNNIVELLMEDEDTKSTFVLPIRGNGDTFEIFITEEDSQDTDQFVDLKLIKEWSAKHDSSRIYNYFLAFLDLAVSLCYDRNYKGINAFVSVFPIEITFGCAKWQALPSEIRSRFTDLLLVLHVDKRPLEPLRIPTLTRIWDVFSDGENDMPVKDQVPEFLGILKDFVRDYLVNKKG